MKTLENYDGRIYHTGDSRGIDGFCLRFKSGSFHYAGKDVVKMAVEAGFEIGYNKKAYSPMPWGLQHTSYTWVPKPEWKDRLISFL